MALHHLLEFGKVCRQSLGCYGGVLYDADRLAVAFDAGKHAKTGFAQCPHSADVVVEDTAAVVCQTACHKLFFESVRLLFHAVAVKLGDEQGFGLTLDEETVLLLREAVAAKFQNLAVHKFHGHGVVAEGYEVGTVAVLQRMAVGAKHHLLLWRQRVERQLYGGDESQCALAAAEEVTDCLIA